MNVELAVMRTCHHCPLIETELKKLGIPYSIRYVEDDVELRKKHNIKGLQGNAYYIRSEGVLQEKA